MTSDLVSQPSVATLLADMPVALVRELRLRQYRIDNGGVGDSEYHPDAAAIAARLRASLRPTTYAIVRGWLNDVVSGGVMIPRDIAIDALAGGIAASCVDFPASVWNSSTLRQALQTFEWLRAPAQVYKLVKPEADKIAALLSGLDAIARAPRAVRYRAAPEYVLPSVPAWVGARRGHGDGSRPALDIQPPRYTIDEQVARLRQAD